MRTALVAVALLLLGVAVVAPHKAARKSSYHADPSAHTRRAQPRRHAGNDQRDDLRAWLDEDDPPAD